MLRLGVENSKYSGLTSLTSKLLLYFPEVNRVHNNDIIRTIFAQECRRHDPLPSARKKFADAVRVYVHDVLDLIVHPKRREKCDGLGSGAPQYRELSGSGPTAQPTEPRSTVAPGDAGKTGAAIDNLGDIVGVGKSVRRSVLRGATQN